MVLAIVALLFAPAHASRSCLDKNEAARTWPSRALAIDDDRCWTYFRRGFKPAPVEDSVNDRAPTAQPIYRPARANGQTPWRRCPRSTLRCSDTMGRPLARRDRGAAEAGVRRTTATIVAHYPCRHRHYHAEHFSDRGRIRQYDRSAQAQNTRPITSHDDQSRSRTPNSSCGWHKPRKSETTDNSTETRTTPDLMPRARAAHPDTSLPAPNE
jgi:hypothetical protein